MALSQSIAVLWRTILKDYAPKIIKKVTIYYGNEFLYIATANVIENCDL